jgi:hypothetical protein
VCVESHPHATPRATRLHASCLRPCCLCRLSHTQVFPKQLLLSLLPPELDILCTHPMFGPDSGKGTWAGLNFMFDPVRVGSDPKRQQRLDLFLNFFRTQGCRWARQGAASPAVHAAAGTQLAHTHMQAGRQAAASGAAWHSVDLSALSRMGATCSCDRRPDSPSCTRIQARASCHAVC